MQDFVFVVLQQFLELKSQKLKVRRCDPAFLIHEKFPKPFRQWEFHTKKGHEMK